MSAIGSISLTLAGGILLLGFYLEEKSPGMFWVMAILATFSLSVWFIDVLDYLLERTVDKWIARYHENKTSVAYDTLKVVR